MEEIWHEILSSNSSSSFSPHSLSIGGKPNCAPAEDNDGKNRKNGKKKTRL